MRHKYVCTECGLRLEGLATFDGTIRAYDRAPGDASEMPRPCVCVECGCGRCGYPRAAHPIDSGPRYAGEDRGNFVVCDAPVGPVYRCASPDCPGYPWRASVRPHPWSTCRMRSRR